MKIGCALHRHRDTHTHTHTHAHTHTHRVSSERASDAFHIFTRRPELRQADLGKTAGARDAFGQGNATIYSQQLNTEARATLQGKIDKITTSWLVVKDGVEAARPAECWSSCCCASAILSIRR